MHLETIQHLRRLAGQHEELVPVTKALLLDLLESYEKHSLQPQILNRCSCSFPHPPHDYCDGTPAATRPLPPEPQYLLVSGARCKGEIWWWAPDRRGYTRSMARAGRYTLEEATRICSACSGEVLMIAESDLEKFDACVVVDLGWGNNGQTFQELTSTPEPKSA